MKEPLSLPRTRAAIDALPYRLEYGHWGLTASIGQYPNIRILASAYFPCGTRGPFDPPAVQDRVFAELDAAARIALGEGYRAS